MSLTILLEIGHNASLRSKTTPDGFTHDWEVFIKGQNGANIHYYVEKVVFYLHETFPKPKRVVKEPPFSLRTSGYAGFKLPIEIYLKNNQEPKKIKFNYELYLQPTGPPIHLVQKEKYTFFNPPEEFRSKLLKGGAVEGSGNLENSVNRVVEEKNQMTSKPKVSGLENTRKHKMKPEEPRNTDFENLFGPPIKKTNRAPEVPKPKEPTPQKPANSEKSSEKEKSDKSKSNKNVHKEREKDKEKLKEKPFENADKKIKEEKRKSKDEKSRDRDRSKEKTLKREREKSSPSRARSPSPKRSPKIDVSPSPVQKISSNKEKEDKKDRDRDKDKKEDKKPKKDKRDHKEGKHKDREKDKEHRDHKSRENKSSREKESSSVKLKEASPIPPPSVSSQNTHKTDKKQKEKEQNKEEEKIEKTEKIEKVRNESDDRQKHKHKKKDRKEKKEEKHSKKEEKKNDKQPSSTIIPKEVSVKEEKTIPAPPIREVDKSNLFGSPKSNSPSTPKDPEPKIENNSLFSKDDESSNDSTKGSSGEASPTHRAVSKTPSLSPPVESPKKLESEKKKDPSPKKKDKKEKKKDKKIDKDKDHEKRKKRKSDPIVIAEEEPLEKVAKIEVDHNSDEESKVSSTEDSTNVQPKSECDMEILRDLQHKIMGLKDNADLQRVVQLIAETGQYEVSAHTFDFDLCLLDGSTVRRLQDFLSQIS